MDINQTSVRANRRGEKQLINKNVIMLILSLAVGAAGVYLAKDFIEKKVNYYKSQLEKTEEMVALVVPNRDIPQGAIVSVRDFSIREIPKKYAHAGAIGKLNFDGAIGQRVGFGVSKGRTLLWAHLEGGVIPTFSGGLEEGKRALAFTVDKINSISGFLQPKDNIDLLLEYNKQVIPVIQNLHVLATGARTRIDKTGRQSEDAFRTITVEVTPEIAEKITLAKSIGKLTALLRSPQDNKPISEQPMTVARLLNKPQPKARSRKKVVRKAKGIEYIIGGTGS
ncbi:MAG: Flp pilus assembly protein CpaB [Candidatus Thiodiazotropha sp. (ex Epidulcina cf. delphinae)]|nr:Flp pilus assembly protein CpaB [Candidatus Thiodiazotropha sp. (ex Epidulcina cf. delphinae)]